MQQSGLPTNGVEDRARDTRFRQELKVRLHRRLMENLDLAQAQKLGEDELRVECFRRIDVLLSEERAPLTTAEKRLLVREVLDEIFGLGPVEELMRDPLVTDILVNGPPWNMRVAVRAHDFRAGPNGDDYNNRVVAFLELRWGRLRCWEDYEDTERIARWDAAVEAAS